MPTYTIYSGSADGGLFSSGGTYAQNRAGTGGGTSVLADATSTASYVGQDGNSGDAVYEAFLTFDTSTVVGTIATATLSIYGVDNITTTDFTATAAVRDYGATLEAADWVAGASLSALTTVATFNTTGYAASYMAFTDVAMPANVNQSGSTRLIIYSNRTSDNNDPTTDELFGFATSEETGTSQDPKLVVVTSGSRPQRHRPYHIWRR